MGEKQPFICSGCPDGWCPGCIPDEQPTFDDCMWSLIRLWCDAAWASARSTGRCSSLTCAWSSICGVLVHDYLGRFLSEKETALVWNSLLEAGYPGWERERKWVVRSDRRG